MESGRSNEPATPQTRTRTGALLLSLTQWCQGQEKWMPRPLVWGVAFLLALAQWRHTLFFYEQDLLRAVQAENGVLVGYPHWRVYQARILSPMIEWAFSIFGLNLAQAHILVAVIVFCLTSVVMFQIGKVVAGTASGWVMLLTFQTAFTMMMSRPWLYIWDYFILFFGAIFLLLMVCRAPWWSFLALLAIACLNHESASFIGVWMIAQSLSEAWSSRSRPKLGMLLGGIFGIVAAQAVIETLRNSLLKKEIGWDIFPDMKKGQVGTMDSFFHLQIEKNLNDLYSYIVTPNFDFSFLLALIIPAVLLFSALLIRRHGIMALPLAVYATSQAGALLVVGLLVETRTILQLTPFLCVAGLLVTHGTWLAAKKPAKPAIWLFAQPKVEG